MRLPRWVLVSLLTVSFLAVLGAGAWSWVTWPERTAREFVSLVAGKRYAPAERMWASSSEEWSNIRDASVQERWSEANIRMEPRSMQLVMQGRQTFSLAPVHQGLYTLKFTAKRGEIMKENILPTF